MALVRNLGASSTDALLLHRLERTASRREFLAALESLVLLEVSVNPESRVKLYSPRSRIDLAKGVARRFLIKIENIAGITAPLNLTGIDLSSDPPSVAQWCKIRVVDNDATSRFFRGDENEYKVVELTPTVSGLREIRIVGDAGQGTQDLGFRATTDLLLNIAPND